MTSNIYSTYVYNFDACLTIRRSGRKVLVHSVRGQGRSAVAVIQYLMQIHHLPMQSAFRVTKLSRTLKINPVFRETLEFLESQLRNEGKLPPVQPQRILAPRVLA
ncbi:hypothetical protein RvY_09010 [Ramazzottius varieornatus]|uniref:Tyrosine specific protein phosphatases domain-containing protein n=1 Tax=Ramazzottius varieornatus TaxID=947166 RepID=A0A1D1VFU7_RAMVA|nr:hypothetical protein RvY_09010 [Ramazzottius varieornatus]